MIIGDENLLNGIYDYIMFLRKNSLRVSISCIDKNMLTFYPLLNELQIHDCSLCDLIKTTAKTSKVCLTNKNILEKRPLPKLSYGCCPYGVEEFLTPVFSDKKLVAYIHATGYAGKEEKSTEIFNFQYKRLTEFFPNLAKQYKKQYAELSRNVPDKKYVAAALFPLSFMLSSFYENYVKGRSVGDRYDLINSMILNYIYENYQQSFSLDEMSNSLNYSLPHLRYVFKLKNGVPLANFITEFRLKKALDKLKNTSCTICEAATSAGFPDTNHFSTLFKKRYGVSPSSFKKR